MVSKAFKLLHIEELWCIFHCIREADEYFESNDAQFRKHIGVNCKSVEELRVAARAELDNRPDSMDDSEPWVASPSLSNMSIDEIAMLSTEELLCFSNCIKATMKYLDDEDQFYIRVGSPIAFSKVFRTALEMELAKRVEKLER